MTMKLAKQNDEMKDKFLEVASETQSEGLGKLVKFNKGKFYIGMDEVTGREMLAHVEGTMRGWVKFSNGKVVAQRVGRIADGFRPPSRDELDDFDDSKWERDVAGKPRDPWSFQFYVPLENDAGEVVVFVTGSKGGIAAVGKLCATFAQNLEKGWPVVNLAVRRYRHSQFGWIETPDFELVAWENHDAKKPAVDTIDDATPF